MTVGDLYPDVRLYSAVETIIMTGGGGGRWGVRWEEVLEGHMGRVGGDRDGPGGGKGHRKGRNQKCKGIISRGWERGNVCGEEMAPPLQLCIRCVLLTASDR